MKKDVHPALDRLGRAVAVLATREGLAAVTHGEIAIAGLPGFVADRIEEIGSSEWFAFAACCIADAGDPETTLADLRSLVAGEVKRRADAAEPSSYAH